MLELLHESGTALVDRELAYAPFNSEAGRQYFAAMCASANFAWTNRQLISWEIKQAWNSVFGKSGGKISLLYDVAHNIAKVEEHQIDGLNKKVIVHRKGATRAFPAGHPELPEEYSQFGQPVLIPGSMGTASYVLAGLPGSMEQSFGSACHGSGRLMSRTKAKNNIDTKVMLKQLYAQGISVVTGTLKGLAEEAPEAYKDVESVVDVVEKAGIAKKVARLVPLAVIKG
jgi:tRNA-splicing ligase RtcB (3'-phosphate/5'-hydroxy nucleic acid ligase)